MIVKAEHLKPNEYKIFDNVSEIDYLDGGVDLSEYESSDNWEDPTKFFIEWDGEVKSDCWSVRTLDISGSDVWSYCRMIRESGDEIWLFTNADYYICDDTGETINFVSPTSSTMTPEQFTEKLEFVDFKSVPIG